MNCKNCGSTATNNVQKVWISWEYNSVTDEYSKNHKLLLDAEGPIGKDNLHFCDECFQKWRKSILNYVMM